MHLGLSDYAYLAQAHGGPLRKEIDSLVRWDETDMLCDELLGVGGTLQHRSVYERKKWLRPFTDVSCGGFTAPFTLAERAVVAIRTRGGTWCQTYHQGWPTTTPFRVETETESCLVVGVELSPQWFTPLPLDPERIRSLVPEEVMQRVRLERLAADSAGLPEVTVRPAIEAWLQQLPRTAP